MKRKLGVGGWCGKVGLDPMERWKGILRVRISWGGGGR